MPAPRDAAVLEQLTAVAADRVFIGQVKEKLRVAAFEPGVGLFDRAHDAALQLVAKLRHDAEPVGRRRAGRMVRVRGVDQHMVGRDARLPLDLGNRRVGQIPRHPKHIAGDNRQLCLSGPLDDHRHRPQLPLLFCRVVRLDPAGDDHRFIAAQIDGRRADAQVQRLLRRRLFCDVACRLRSASSCLISMFRY